MLGRLSPFPPPFLTLHNVFATVPSSNETCMPYRIYVSTSRYYQVENTQEDILNRVFLILWINAFNSCKDRLRYM